MSWGFNRPTIMSNSPVRNAVMRVLNSPEMIRTRTSPVSLSIRATAAGNKLPAPVGDVPTRRTSCFIFVF